VKKALLVAGARPNFVKIAPIIRAMRQHSGLIARLVHTGQHYDVSMSAQFFRDLEIPEPDFNLAVGSASHAVQTAEIMMRLEPILLAERPDVVIVVGDVNSTLAAALTAAKLGIPLAHVEAGLRSFDRSMPEEINRAVVDALSDLLFVTEESGCVNLRREGVAEPRIYFVGNVMIDTLETTRSIWERSALYATLGLDADRPYAVLTLHRPSNVDDPQRLVAIFEGLQQVARHLPIVFPVHPRAAAQLASHLEIQIGSPEMPGSLPGKGIVCLDPMGYLEFIALMSRARLVLTDSGGIQDETTGLGVPCLTLRDNTERPVTITHGTNRVIGTDPQRIVQEALAAVEHPRSAARRPPYWDGRAAERIVAVVGGAVALS